METEGAPVDDAVVELLGYDPENFLDDVINAANTLIYNALTSLQKFVEKEMNGPNSETEQGMVKMETLMEQAVDTWFLKFETECRAKIFKAPDSLKPLLPQYRDLDFDSLESEVELDNQIEALRVRLHEKKAKIEQLSKALRAASKLQPLVKEKCMDFIWDTMRDDVR